MVQEGGRIVYTKLLLGIGHFIREYVASMATDQWNCENGINSSV